MTDRELQIEAILLEHSTGLADDATFVRTLMSIEATDAEIETAQAKLRERRGTAR